MVALEDRIRTVLREHYGNFSTVLELEYENKLMTALLEEDNHNRNKWATYNQVILEFKDTIKDRKLVEELQYRLTDFENPNSVCMDIINNFNRKTPELDRLYHKIMNFED
jgi:hypothetical protein